MMGLFSSPPHRAASLLLALLVLLLALPAQAQIPHTMSYQGVLAEDDGTPVADGDYALTFTLYDADTDGTALWTETVTAAVAGGVFSVLLGEDEPLSSLLFDRPYWLGVAVGDAAELVPRIPLSSVPYSFSARGVYGTTNVFPHDGDVGIGTEPGKKDAVPAAKLDVEGDLRIADVPYLDDPEKMLVHDPIDQIVKFVWLDTLKARGLAGPAGPPGPMGPPGPRGPAGPPGGFGGILIGIDFIMISTSGDTLVFIDGETGESFHKGFEIFEGGLRTGGDVGDTPSVVIDDAGITVYDKDDNVLFDIDAETGDSYHKGDEIYDGDIVVRDGNGQASVVLSETGIDVIDENGSILTSFFRDGTSLHFGKETYHGGITLDSGSDFVMLGANGDTLTSIDGRTGESYHKGFEIFEGGLFSGDWTDDASGVHLGETGITVFDEDGNIVFYVNAPTGESYHAGHEVFEGGLTVVDSETDLGFELSEDFIGAYDEAGNLTWGVHSATGESIHHGHETFTDGITVEGVTDFVGDVAFFNEFDQPIMHIMPNANPISAYMLGIQGNVMINGMLQASQKNFRIDHPLDPANKYLVHTSMESPDRLNVYSGNAVLEADGAAWVTLPDYFDVMNKEFRYQLTCVGGYAPVYVAEEVAGNRFRIAGGQPGLKVSWQITAVRDDAFARTYDNPVEIDKPVADRGRYLHPEAFGLSADLRIGQETAVERPAPPVFPERSERALPRAERGRHEVVLTQTQSGLSAPRILPEQYTPPEPSRRDPRRWRRSGNE